MATENIAICFDVPRSLKAELDSYKAQTGAPNAFVVRTALTEFFQRRQQKEQQQEQVA